MIGKELSVRFFSPPDPENSRNCNSTNSVTSILVSLAAAALRDDTRELWQLGNDDGDGNEDVKKAIGLYQQHNNFASASRFFVHFFTVLARLRRENA